MRKLQITINKKSIIGFNDPKDYVLAFRSVMDRNRVATFLYETDYSFGLTLYYTSNQADEVWFLAKNWDFNYIDQMGAEHSM